MRTEYILILLVGFATALPLALEERLDINLLKQHLENAREGERDGFIESLILEALEILRRLMVNGTDTIPALDPLTIDRIHVDESILNIPNAYITLNNLTVRDLSTFEAEEINFSLASFWLQRYKIDFNIMIPAVNVNTSSYDLSLMVFGGNIYGKGDMGLQIVKPRVKGYFVISLRISSSGIFLNLHECRISIGLDAFIPSITGMFGNEASSDFVSAFLGNLIPELLSFFEEEITNILSSIVLVIGNLILSDLDLGSLLPFPLTQN